MSPLTVAPGPGAEKTVTAVLSSLPVSFTPAAGDATAGLVVVAGVASWPADAAAALQHGSSVVAVVHPQPADVSALQRLTNPPLALDHLWASNPAVPAAAAHFAAAAAGADLLECRVTVADDTRSLPALLLDAAALIRSLVGPLLNLAVLHHDASGFVAAGTVSDLHVSISVQRSTALAAHAYLRVLTRDGGTEMAIPHPETARPAEIVITDLGGAHTLPTIWESAHRATWRRVLEQINTSTADNQLAAFADDQHQIAPALNTLAH